MAKYGIVVLSSLIGFALGKWQTVDEAGFREADHSSLETFEKEWYSLQTSQQEGTVISINCSASQALCREFDVVSFPTVRLHGQDGQFERYRGPRKAEDIIAYLRRMSRPAVSSLDATEASSFTSVDDVVIVASVGEDDDDLGFEERFSRVAQRFQDRYSFAVQQRKAGGTSLECVNNVDSEAFSITDLSDPLAIENFIRQCSQPLVPEFTRRNEGELTKMGKSIIHYFTSSDTDRKSYVNAIRALAKRYQEYLLFVTTDVAEYPHMASMMGHREGASNVLSVFQPVNGGVFVYRGQTITAETVERFLGDISSGRVKMWDGVLPEADAFITHEEL
ncbi:hypothetical protein M406DRAFT_339425 [Cryphonectria parasitica EP155]|uniref:Thioredoxin domain-containing protein n=1 Tax=Cryphonectria parasitica (strain ATCC 38755 / EP155) TaxID=660469 RepID=A0A9P4Y417_CRYP1|nr:uncharacterized protein M406DRAFT_339425 [Cryphonectria parasitica EP155]KAF3766148.1 hypothetical protein M406DRAFT_339425 [Cryphonectria parasitica EP155]